MQVKILKVKIDNTDKKGDALISKKTGKPYYKVGIQTEEHGALWLNSLMPFSPDRWEGTKQDIEVYDEEYQGKTYKKFRLPKREGGGFNASAAEVKNLLTFKVIPLLLENNKILKSMIDDPMRHYPTMDETNDAHGLDEREVPDESYDDPTMQ